MARISTAGMSPLASYLLRWRELWSTFHAKPAHSLRWWRSALGIVCRWQHLNQSFPGVSSRSLALRCRAIALDLLCSSPRVVMVASVAESAKGSCCWLTEGNKKPFLGRCSATAGCRLGEGAGPFFEKEMPAQLCLSPRAALGLLDSRDPLRGRRQR